MAFIKDNAGTEWELVFSLRAISSLCKRLNITMAKLTMMEIPLGELLESLHLFCGKQMRERNITEQQFYDLIDDISFPEIITALRESLVEAFPNAQLGGQEGDGPFAPGN